MQKNLSYLIIYQLISLILLINISLHGMDKPQLKMRACQFDVKMQIVHALIKASPSMPAAVKQIKKVVYFDPLFAQALNTASMSQIIQILAQQFNTRKYDDVANALLPKKFEGANSSPTLAHWGQLIRDWYQNYNQFSNAIYDLDLVTVKNLFTQYKMPSDEIADDFAEYLQQAQLSRDALRKLSVGAKIAILAQIGPEHERGVVHALQYHEFNHLCSEGQNRDAIKRSLKAAKNINYYDKDGYTALYFSIYLNSLMGVEELLLAGADPNQKNFEGKTALMEAVDRDNGTNPAIVQKLIAAGADTGLRNPLGETALQSAQWQLNFRAPEQIRNNRQEVVKLLETAAQGKSNP